MRRLLPSIGAVLALLATARANPFYLPNEHPVTRLFGIPPAESGFVADGTRVFGSLNVANNSHDDLAGRETLRLDGETYVARLAVRHSFSPAVGSSAWISPTSVTRAGNSTTLSNPTTTPSAFRRATGREFRLIT